MSMEPPETKGCVTPAVFKCAYPAPYPEVRVAGPNLKYAQLLLEDYLLQPIYDGLKDPCSYAL